MVRLFSYAQNQEDVVLWRALKDVKLGRYLDIGAHDPIVDSVSRAFYDLGWRGTHVEPAPALAERLRKNRPDETVIESLISDSAASVDFNIVEDTGLSTADRRLAKRHSATWNITKKTLTPRPLSEVFDLMGRGDIHWLKIDVEGWEGHVIKSWGDHPARPWVLCIEAYDPISGKSLAKDWEAGLVSRNYNFVHNDGLNHYYLHQSQQSRATLFGDDIFAQDDFVLAPHLTQAALKERVHNVQLVKKLAKSAKAVKKTDANLKAFKSLQRKTQAALDHAEATIAHRDAVAARDLARERELRNIGEDSHMAAVDALRGKAFIGTNKGEFAETQRRGMELQHTEAIYQKDLIINGLREREDHLVEEVEAHRQMIEAMTRSTSWKVGAPIRWAGQGIKLLFRGGRKILLALVSFVVLLKTFGQILLNPNGWRKAFRERFQARYKVLRDSLLDRGLYLWRKEYAVLKPLKNWVVRHPRLSHRLARLTRARTEQTDFRPLKEVNALPPVLLPKKDAMKHWRRQLKRKSG